METSLFTLRRFNMVILKIRLCKSLSIIAACVDWSSPILKIFQIGFIFRVFFPTIQSFACKSFESQKKGGLRATGNFLP